MARYRALIVEDSIDVRRALKAALELLLHEFQVADVPSAEEGLLEFFRQPVDLLITDFRLPGMTGFELMERMRAKKPDMKVILVTGMPEPEYRSQALAAGVDAFFYKPIEIADFIAAIQTIFSLPSAPPQPAAEAIESRPASLGDVLAQLRKRTQAQAVFLVDDLGYAAAQAGEFHEFEPNAVFVPVLATAANASRKLSLLLGSVNPESLVYIRGEKTDFLFSPVGPDLLLLLVLPQRPGGEVQSLTYKDLRPELERLRGLLGEMGVSARAAPVPEIKPPAVPGEAVTLEASHDLELEAIVQAGSPRMIKTDDLNAFWEQVAVSNDAPPSTNPEVLSYEEARRLGLTPDSDSAALAN
jgi:CheY-like chemotaxis protein/predicted regulator of Ras-like GTPase activity (Roadblock/LC7/MglB family)